MVHGVFFRDTKLFNYWGRVPAELESNGAKIYYGNHQSALSIEDSARELALRIKKIVDETDCGKLNIIAHSKGGLDSRYAISSLKSGGKVASLTTISTPHHGSKTMDMIMKFPGFLVKFSCACADLWFRILGDKKPDTYKVLCSFTTCESEKFNKVNPDFKEVYYQSFAFVMKKPSSDMSLWFSNAFINRIEGENDGLVTPDSAKWGEFRGVFTGVGRRGISHCDEVDMRRRPLAKKEGNGVRDILDLYVDIARGLIEKGY